MRSLTRILKLACGVTTAFLLASCGGGGGCSGASFDNPGGCTATGASASPVATVDALASSNQLNSGGGQVTITAVVKNSNNNAVANEAVTFSASSGTLSSATPVTDASGVATANLSAGANKSNRTITVTVTAGGISNTVQVNVVGTTVSISGPTAVTFQSTATYSIKVADSNNVGIGNISVALSSTLGNGFSATSVTTDGSGAASVVYTGTNAGTDTIRATSAGTSGSVSVVVSAVDFTFTAPAPNTTIPIGVSQTLTVQYLSSGVPQAGQTILFTATAGTLSAGSAVTNAAGQATVSISSTFAGVATVQATVSGGSAQALLPIQFVADTPASLVLQVTPSAIPPTTSSSSQQKADVIAVVRDANSNPVADVTVNFSRDADPSGGSLSQPSAVTDSNGRASVQYISGPSATATDGVVLRGTVQGTSVTGTTTLTVSQQALFITLGTGNTISNKDITTYQKDWTVYVTDANGVAVPNVQLTISVLPERYLKGVLGWDGASWSYSVIAETARFLVAGQAGGEAVTCANEDIDRDGTLDAGEDVNGNGRLEPDKAVSVSPGTVTTDAEGFATISLLYAESLAPWLDVTLKATAVVSGTESSAQARFVITGASADFTNETIAPAGVDSPFGTFGTCTDPN